MNLLAYDICSVQAIDNRVAMVNFMKYNYGETKGSTQAGSTFADVRNYYNSDANYTSDSVEGEALNDSASTTAHTGTLDWTPVIPGTFTAKTAGGVVVKDDGAGKLTAASGLTADGSINYTTGEYSFTLTNADTVTASYKYGNEHVPASKVPTLTLSIESLPIRAKARRLAALWGFEAGYELSKEYGEDFDQNISTTAATEIQHEIDLEIMADMYNIAADSSQLAFSTVPGTGVSRQDHYDSFAINLQGGSNEVYQKTKRIRPNFIICGTNVATVAQSIRTFKPSAEAASAKGPYLAGTIGALKVFVSPDYDPDVYVMGYKGDNFLDAGYIYAPYLPVTSTSVVQFEDMMSRKGWCTMYGKRPVNSSMYLRGKITRS